MHYIFEFLGENILLDVESSSLHVVDKMVAAALTDERAAREAYGDPGVDEALAELAELRENGMLDCPEPEAPVFLERPVKAMCLHVAHDCDLRCTYCFAQTGSFKGERSLLPLETGKRAIDWLVEASGNREALEVDFFGGEPLLNFPVVQELVRYGREVEKKCGKRFSFTLTTNGVALTDEIIDFCNTEIFNVVLSLDGRKDIHDAARKLVNGEGSYDVVAEKLVKFAKSREARGLEYFVRGTYTAKNLDFSKDVLAIADMGVRHISLEPVVLPRSHPLAITEEHLERIFAEYDELARLCLERMGTDDEFYFFHFHTDLADGPCLAKRVSGCGAGNEYIAVTPGGELYPCHQFVGDGRYKMGNIQSPALESAIRAACVKTTLYSKPECRACWAKYACGGGCMAGALKLGGKIDQPDPIACALQRKRTECALGIAAFSLGEK